jgi:hypothetical protein
MEISLERLVASPTEEVAQICDFINVEPDETLRMCLCKIRPDKAHTGTWRQQLSEADLETISPYLEPFIEAYQYY